MRTTLLSVAFLFVVLTLLPSRAPACGGYGSPTFTAHEWGTFTSVQGADGVQPEWNPFAAPDLPPFVYNVNKNALNPRARSYPLYLAKTAVRSLQRMETPVIYFYSDRERTVDVTVQFPQGHVTEWFPQLHPDSFKTPGRITKLVWDRVTILPRTQHPREQSRHGGLAGSVLPGSRSSRPVADGSAPFPIGAATIDPKTYQVRRGRAVEELTAKELKLLQLFHAHPGEVMSRDRLLNEVWGYHYYGTTRTLDQVVVQLRKKLGDNGGEPKHLLTVHGVGYKLVL